MLASDLVAAIAAMIVLRDKRLQWLLYAGATARLSVPDRKTVGARRLHGRSDACVATPEALACTERTEELWIIVDLLRTKGERLLL